METDELDKDTDLETNGEAPSQEKTEEGEQPDFEAELKKVRDEAAKYRRLYEKSQKASTQASDEEGKTTEKKQDTDFGYAEKAYLNSLGITGSDAHNLIFDIARKTGDSLDDIAQSEYVQGKLKALKTQEATPSGTKRANTSARDTVEYWIEKGELPPADQIELRRKVVNEKLKRAKSGNRFGNTDVEVR